MQRANCTVRLSGDVGNTVLKERVSPAEIVILRDLHGGPDAVIDIQPTHMDKTPHQTERARLVNIYGHHVVDRIFPGQFTPLPVSLKDIEVAAPVDEDAADEAADEATQDTGPELDESDIALIDLVKGSKTKQDLYTLAKDNEVDLSSCEDKLDALKAHIIGSLFPGFKG